MKNNKTETVKFRLTVKEKQLLLKHAQDAGISPSDYLRDAILNEDVRKALKRIEEKL